MNAPRLFLVIDDNPDDRALVVRALNAEFPATRCREIAEAVALEDALVQGGFDAVVTDYQLLWTTGLEVLRALRLRYPEVPVVMFTNTGSEEVCAAAMREGLHDYLVKKANHYVMLPAAVRSGMAVAQARRAVREHALALEAALAAETMARADAERADRLKDEFLSTLSHELRTPLNAILGWANVLLRAPDNVGTVTKGAQVIERNVKVQVRIIEDLLDVSKIVSGNLRLEPEPVELIPVVDAAVDAVSGAADAKGVKIERVLDMGAGAVLGDPARLQQVVWNLLSNAIKFSGPNGRIEIRLERSDARVALVVADEGEGIAPDFLPHVFDRLRQADGSTTRRHSGLGLGLSIVKHLVGLHGGEVRAESPGRGHGSRFTVVLPALAPSAPTGRATDRPRDARAGDAARVRADAVDLAGLDVLVVDDEPDVRELLADLLENVGAQARVTASAQAALQEFDRRRPDILVSDISMAEEDGYSLISKIRAIEGSARRVPSIALTAFARAEDRRKALLAGFQLHLAKPLEPAELIAAIASLAGRTGR